MSQEIRAEQRWRWTQGLSPERLRGPTESFWRGLGYEIQAEASTVRGHRDLDGQRREFTARFGSPGAGTTEVDCWVTFVGEPGPTRPTEVYDPAELVRLFGQALARGFGPPAAVS